MDDTALVIYYDNGNKPIFRTCFAESGIPCRSWLKNYTAFLVYSLCEKVNRIGLFFRNYIYAYPEDMEGLIILFDTKLPEFYLRRILEKNPRAQIIVWYWNEVKSEKKLQNQDAFDIWSYSPADCREYWLIYNSQFYFDSVVKRYRDVREQREMRGERSFIFMGREKGRSDQINAVAEAIKQCGWGCQIDYLSTCKNDRPHKSGNPYTKGFGYDTYVQKVMAYQGILDVAFKENSGLSLRTMESIFFHKKLITNNSLVSTYDFYDENNIYIWGKSGMSLEEFLARPYRPVPDSICNQYLITSWLARFKEYYGMK